MRVIQRLHECRGPFWTRASKPDAVGGLGGLHGDRDSNSRAANEKCALQPTGKAQVRSSAPLICRLCSVIVGLSVEGANMNFRMFTSSIAIGALLCWSSAVAIAAQNTAPSIKSLSIFRCNGLNFKSRGCTKASDTSIYCIEQRKGSCIFAGRVGGGKSESISLGSGEQIQWPKVVGIEQCQVLVTPMRGTRSKRPE